MKERAIGVFDSGLGGLSAVKELISILPNENIVYFGDTGRVPYGNRSRETIQKYARQDAGFLLQKNVKAVIAACGTVSSVVQDLGDSLPVLYTGVVDPTCRAAVSATRTGKIGVIGTTATISSHSYKKCIAGLDGDIAVVERDCPLFVPLVENGFTDKDDVIVRGTVERYLGGLTDLGIDTLILGCTHYPILRDAISAVLGDGVRLIDSGHETALYTADMLNKNDLLNTSDKSGSCSFFVSDTPDNFESIAGLFLGRDMHRCVTRIDIEQY